MDKLSRLLSCAYESALTALAATSPVHLIAKYLGYILTISSIGVHPFSLTGFALNYVNPNDPCRFLTVSVKFVSLTLHIPRASNPRFATFRADSYYHADAEHQVSVARVSATLWVFPFYFGQTGGSWVSSVLDDYRVRVVQSKQTPNWVQRVRRDFVATILRGDIMRVDDLSLKTHFAGLTSTAENSAPAQPDEMRLTVAAEGYQAKNWQDRVYTFKSLRFQLRRAWIHDRGSYALVAEKVQWIQVAPVHRRLEAITAYRWKLILYSIFSFPFDLLHLYCDPISVIDVYIPSLNVGFDDFRTRDAEMVKQVFSMAAERVGRCGGGVIGDWVLDAVASLVVLGEN
ncbi:hypothetical protein HYDPIDRAFT_109515 [Hydnomerulius pinastri MD-312]|nr:hypothetical protein HYDPIDRAFT_109515 [Hydnomerulius pinastri MD-312]